MSQATADTISLELYLRSYAPDAAHRRQQSIRERVESLADRPTVDGVTVESWSSRVCAPDGGESVDACPRIVSELLAVAADSDISLDPAFRTSDSHTDDEVIYLPVACLVVRSEDDVRGVYPATVDGHHESVTDALEALEDGADVANV
ncbi:MAG: HTH domain-containing protein [Haloarculaceae archaeon]